MLVRSATPLAVLPAFWVAAAALALCAVSSGPLAAQQVQAFYPLITDLLDATNTYGPMTLSGTPAPNLPNNGVCVNGIYALNAGGQDVRTPVMPTLDTTDFEIDVEFEIAAFPANFAPVLMGGNGWRWLGIYLQSNGLVGIKHNNSNLAWSSTTLTTGVWYAAELKHEAGITQLFINGALVLQVATGPLNDGNNKNITTNDFSNGRNFNGCIRNLVVLNDTTIVARAQSYGAGCAGTAGVPALAAANTPQFGAAFALSANALAAASPFAFMAVGTNNTNAPFGPLPFPLQVFGLAAGCNLLCSADTMSLFGVSGGVGTLSLNVPSNTRLFGTRLYFQCASIDNGATGGVAVSNGVEAVVGY